MKKIMILVLVLVLTLACTANGFAQTKLFTINQVNELTSPKWQQIYEAYGRTIDIDVDVNIPNVNYLPVIKVKAASPIEGPLFSELKTWCTKAKAEDKVNNYSFRSTNFNTVVTNAVPPAWGRTRDSEFEAGLMGQNEYDLYQYDLNTAYADNNPLTIGEASSIAIEQIQKLFPNEELKLRRVYLSDRTFMKQSGKPISTMGNYNLCFSQVFHGIPFMTSVHSVFSTMFSGSEDPWLDFRGVSNASVYSADAWSFTCCFYEECDVLYNDISILPFDTVKEQVESLILSGHVRWIDDISLGYVQFDSETPDEQILVPCWVVWCEYHSNGAKSERGKGENGSSSLMYDGNNELYRPLVINAQTGELIDPESVDLGRSACPQILTR